MRKISDPERRSAGTQVFRIVLAAGLLLSLAANLPGHLTLDSVIALEEARTGVRQTWAPAAVSWILGVFDEALSGTGLYVTASSCLLTASLMSLADLRARTPWLAAVVAAAAIFTPQLLIFQGVVWKDVLFANLVLAGFACLAHAAEAWGVRRPFLALAGALACLALAAIVRQNGIVLVAAAAVALGWTARSGGWRASLGWGLGGLAATLALATALDRMAQPDAAVASLRPNAAILILYHYDVVGARARDPAVRLDEIGRVNPAARREIEANAARIYSPARVDTLDQEETFRKALWRLPDAVMAQQWRDVVLGHPGAYLGHRLEVFRWVFLTPDLDRCLPVHVGVTGPEPLLRKLDMVTGVEPQDKVLSAYATRLFHTPVYSHLTYALIAVAVSGLLLLRRSPADGVVVALLLGSLAFTASFLVISVACDYRYLYVLDLAAMAGLIYLALDPVTWRRRTG